MRFPRAIITGFALAALIYGSIANASSVAVDSSFFTGSRTTSGNGPTGGGLTWNPGSTLSPGPWSNGGFSISWVITNNGSDFTYRYEISTTGHDLSHWILPLSEFDAGGASLETHWNGIFVNKTTGNYTNSGIKNDEEVGVFGPGSSNPGIPGSVFGVKLNTVGDPSTSWVEFTTSQIPIWGDFYGKDGKVNPGQHDVYVYNENFGIDATLADDPFLQWIPRPDGALAPAVVPESSPLLIWTFLSVIGMCWGRYRWQRTTADA